MSGRARTSNGDETYQWVDGEVCMVIDTITREPWHDADGCVMMSLERAIALAGRLTGREHRTVIVRLPAIVPYRLEAR